MFILSDSTTISGFSVDFFEALAPCAESFFCWRELVTDKIADAIFPRPLHDQYTLWTFYFV